MCIDFIWYVLWHVLVLNMFGTYYMNWNVLVCIQRSNVQVLICIDYYWPVWTKWYVLYILVCISVYLCVFF